MTNFVRRLALFRATLMLTLSMVAWMSGAGTAYAADALIVGSLGVNELTTYLTAAGYTVTVVNPTVPANLSSYSQVWDIRYSTALVPADVTSYNTYLGAGGSLFLIGEITAFNTRNNSVISYILSLGGGSLGTLVNAGPGQTVQPPFTGPNAVTTIDWLSSGRVPTAGSGAFIAKDATGGSAVAFGRGTLSGAMTGALIVAFDVHFLFAPQTASEPALAKNMISFLAVPPAASTPSPLPPTAFAPTITSIANQVVAVSASTTVPFTVGGSVIPYALSVRASSSNQTFVSTLTFNRVDRDGHWTLTVAPADGRSGSAVITVTVSDGTRETSTSFMVATSLTTLPLLHTEPANLVASASGSGVVLTWSAPDSGSPARYVVSVTTTPEGSNLWVFVTPDASTSYVIPMVPPGTYYFRVQAVADALGLPSNEASVAATGSTIVMGVPTGLVATVNGPDLTVTWTPPAGGAPPLYLVEFGTAAGHSDLAVVPSVTSTYTRRVSTGLYFMRVRSFNGGAASAASSDASITVAPGACSDMPFVPVLLPVSNMGSVVSFSWLPPASWLPAAGTVPDRYRIDLTASSGVTTTITTGGAGTSATWTAPAGTYRARVTAGNQCGVSAQSNEVSFGRP